LPHLGAGGQQGIGEGADLLLGLAQQMEGQTLGSARTDAWQSLELVDQPGQGSGETAQGSGASKWNLGGSGGTPPLGCHWTAAEPSGPVLGGLPGHPLDQHRGADWLRGSNPKPGPAGVQARMRSSIVTIPCSTPPPALPVAGPRCWRG
jgi:hypothetical protein